MKKLISVALLCMSFCSCIVVDPYTTVYGETYTPPTYRYYAPPTITTYQPTRPYYVRPYYVRPYYVRPCFNTPNYYQTRHHHRCRK